MTLGCTTQKHSSRGRKMDGVCYALLTEKLLRLVELEIDGQLAQAQGTFMPWVIAAAALVAFTAGAGLTAGFLMIFLVL